MQGWGWARDCLCLPSRHPGLPEGGSRTRAVVPSEAGGSANDFLIIEEVHAMMSKKALQPQLSPLPALYHHIAFYLVLRVDSLLHITLTCFPALPRANESRAGLSYTSCISAAWDIVDAQNIFVG